MHPPPGSSTYLQMTSSTEKTFHTALRRVHFARRAQLSHLTCVREKELWPQSVRQARFSMAKLIQPVRLTQIARMGHDQRPRHHLHPTSRHCSTPCRRTQGSESLDPATALRPLPREESGLLRGRRGTCLRLVHLGRLQM